MQSKKQHEVVFCAKLRALMKSKGLKQHHLVSEFGVTQAAVSRWYNGSIPNPEILPKLSAILGVSVDFLLDKQPAVVNSKTSHHNTHIHSSNLHTCVNLKNETCPIKKVKISELERSAAELRAMIQGLQEGLKGLEKAIEGLTEN
jgi:transcriptional regulator with XRE-family HTH domain